MTPFVGLEKDEIHHFKLILVEETGQQIRDISVIVSLEFLRKKFDSLSSTLHKSVQNAEMYVEI